MDENLKAELVRFVLERTKPDYFNESIKRFSIQMLYSRQKRELMSVYRELMPTPLYYSVAMSEAFREYKCDEIDCPKLLFKIDRLRGLLPWYKKSNLIRWAEKVQEYNCLVKEYSEKLVPQNKLIKLYKKIRRESIKKSGIIEHG